MGAKCRIILPIQGVYTIPAHTRTTGCFYVSKVSHHRGIESLDWLPAAARLTLNYCTLGSLFVSTYY